MIVVIPARGGSKGVPGKNIKNLQGKPLIAYTLEAARELFPADQIVVSTDSQEIKEIVEGMGVKVPFLRPPELATDKASTYEVLLHALEQYESKNRSPEQLVLLQPTSPFRRGMHIKGALEVFDKDLDMVVSVKETAANPYYVLREENEEGFLVRSKEGNFNRRQDCPRVWEINGAIYVMNTRSLKKMDIKDFKRVRKYEMDEIASHDIDSPLDWLIAETIMENQRQGSAL